MAGVKEKLMSGVWCSILPVGYESVGKGDKKEFVLNEKGKLAKKAFIWKSEGLSNDAIREKLNSVGWKIDKRRITDLLRNPFYCGIIAHNALEGEMVEGIQEKAVSKELFLRVNGILDKRKHGYSMKPINEEVPLKRFISCDVCGKYLTAYKATKNQEYYYKCDTIGCCCNKRSDALHESFKTMLDHYNLSTSNGLNEIIKTQMTITYNQLNKDKVDTSKNLGKQIIELDKKIERLEERLINEEIDNTVFTKYSNKFKEEKAVLRKELASSSNNISNLQKCIDSAINYSSKLNTLWTSADYHQKQQIQFLVFPNGIRYNRKKDQSRTERVNSIFSYIAQLVRVVGKEKNEHKDKNISVSAFVENIGLEPITSNMPCLRSTR
jgi:site-specific DNA recombinase